MNQKLRSILDDLDVVQRLHAEAAGNPDLDNRLRALKAYQARRFEHTYADLLASARYKDAVLFFLEELYGPHEFNRRDIQFARVVPSIVRIFPADVVDTVTALCRLHAISESLDLMMAKTMTSTAISAVDYVNAWRVCDRDQSRQEQIDLTLQIGRSLDLYTRSTMIRSVIRVMRSPAKLARLDEIHGFLERGYETFRRMQGAAGFLEVIQEREQLFKKILSGAGHLSKASSHADTTTFAQLPDQPETVS